ncbi:MAG: hypothetical protein QNK23_14290 [Crocinitomicaceae bacterium]|nr:hypothetical protein [Crocinitomicaceae bacterium]
MKSILSIFALLFSLSLSSQVPEGGQNIEMKANKVKSVTEFSMNFGFSDKPDTNWINTKRFNERGFLIREEFRYMNQECYYEFEYNASGYIINVDSTSNNYNYSRSSIDTDTVYNTETIVWEHLPDGTKREKTVTSYWYDEMVEDSTVQILNYSYTTFGKIENIINKSHDLGLERQSTAIGKYIYDEKNQLIEVQILDVNNNIIMKSLYIYEYY